MRSISRFFRLDSGEIINLEHVILVHLPIGRELWEVVLSERSSVILDEADRQRLELALDVVEER